jgi:phospholipid/cholesterol/gamma-HCH transport system ATP-binding protein
MIEVKNIGKSFGEKIVLNDVSTVMEAGKTNLIIGASGSGKTVLMKCLVGLIKPDKGQILYEGNDITKLEDKEWKDIRTQIGMLFQGSALFDSMNVERNVRFPLDMFTNLTRKQKADRVNEVLSKTLRGQIKSSPQR